MNSKFEYFYLQRNLRDSWETLSQSDTAEGLVDAFQDNISSEIKSEIRIVGARFDDTNQNWLYEQLFYINSAYMAPGSGKPIYELVNQTHGSQFNEKIHKSITKSKISPVNNYIDQSSNKAFDIRLAYMALILAGIIAGISFGVRTGFGLFLGPITLDFGFGRETFALSIAIQNLVWGIVQPFTGAIADRYGPFRTIVLGTIFYAAGMVLLAYSTTAGMFHLSVGVLVGVGLSGTGTGILMPAAAKLFPENRRSWVLGVVGATGSLGHFMFVPTGQALIESFGWSSSALIIGVFIIIMIPLGLVFLKTPTVETSTQQVAGSISGAMAEAFSHPSFWLLCIGFFVCGFHVIYIATHLPIFVVDMGFSAQTGAWALAVVGLANVVGGYTAGVLGGKYSKKYLLSFLYLGRAVIMAGIVLLPPSEILVYGFAVAMGAFWLSTVPLTTGLVADLYGTRYMTTLFGIVFFFHQIGGFLGGWLGGYIYDLVGSYDIVWWISVALGLMSAIVHWPIRPLPEKRLAIAS